MTTQSTPQSRLALVRKAIAAILETGQSVQYDNRSVSHADIEKLRKLEQQYEAEAKGETGGKCAGRNSIVYVDPMA